MFPSMHRLKYVLAQARSPRRVIWRYDPIVFTGITPPAFHEENFRRLAESLRGHTRRVVVSIVDMYRKIEKRMKALDGTPAAVRHRDADDLGSLMRRLAEIADENGMEIVSCAEEIDLRPFGILPGKCVDDRMIAEAFGIEVPRTKDPTQRKACGCVTSRDVGNWRPRHVSPDRSLRSAEPRAHSRKSASRGFLTETIPGGRAAGCSLSAFLVPSRFRPGRRLRSRRRAGQRRHHSGHCRHRFYSRSLSSGDKFGRRRFGMSRPRRRQRRCDWNWRGRQSPVVREGRECCSRDFQPPGR